MQGGLFDKKGRYFWYNQKFTVEALEKANLEIVSLKGKAMFLEIDLSYYVKEVEQAKVDALRQVRR